MVLRALRDVKSTFVVAMRLAVLALLLPASAYALDDEITEYFTVPAGSYVIDMGQPQTIGSGVKPYGLIFDLVTNERVPVWWVIDPPKRKTESTLRPTAAVPSSYRRYTSTLRCSARLRPGKRRVSS